MNKSEERILIKIFTTIVLIIAIILMFNMYTTKNKERIEKQNASYIKNYTKQAGNWLEDIFYSAECSIKNTAKMYSNNLQSPKVSIEDLKGMSDRTIFDYVDFVNAEGIDISYQGNNTDVSDRAYFIKGMQGESGIDGTYTSKITGERLVVFYAPVKYKNEVIGVLVGHYLEERMKRIIENTLFDEQVPSFLCLNDGTIVSSNILENVDSNILDFIDNKVDTNVENNIKKTLEEEREYGFSYKTDKGTIMAYMTSLTGNHWTLIQCFPRNALNKMKNEANAAGIILEVGLVLLFIIYILSLLLQEWYKRKRLLQGKLEAERIIKGVNRLFSQFIVVNLKSNTYEFVNGQEPNFKDIPAKGEYDDFINFYKNKFVAQHIGLSMEKVLSKENIIKILSKDNLYEQYEYQIVKDDKEMWRNMSIIALEWKEDELVSVLLVVQEITGLKEKELQTQNALKEAYSSAKAANNAKSEFLSRMSHDIRTLMNAIVVMTAIATLYIDDKARVEDCLKKITISSKHLLRLINDILDMSRIESGKLELVNEEFKLSELVNELLGIFQPQIEAKKQKLTVTLSGIEHEKVIGDSQKLSQVLVNIMGNAVKFTPEGGNLSLHINETHTNTLTNGCYEFTISDTGIGMDEEFVGKMFEPFARADENETGKIEGTGLGMSIAKNIVSMMNGDIKVKSKKGEGTRVKATVYLRYALEDDEELNMFAGHHVMVIDNDEEECENVCKMLESINMISRGFTDSDQAVEELVNVETYKAVIIDWKMNDKDGLEVTKEIRQKVGADMPIILSADNWTTIEQDAVSAGVNEFISKPLFRSSLIYVMKRVLVQDENEESELLIKEEEQFSGKRILVVEDNELNREMAHEILTISGFTVDEAINGEEAVKLVTESKPGTYEVVLMDIQMPVMNGYEATKAIRKSQREDLKTLPIVAMTANAFSDDIRKAKEAGMNGHISKPVDINKLISTLKNLVN